VVQIEAVGKVGENMAKKESIILTTVVCIVLVLMACRKEPADARAESGTKSFEQLQAEAKNEELQDRIEKIQRKLMILEVARSEDGVEDLKKRLGRLEMEQGIFGDNEHRIKEAEKRLDLLESKVLMLETRELEREMGLRKQR